MKELSSTHLDLKWFAQLSSSMKELISPATYSSSMGFKPRPKRTCRAPTSSSKHTLGSSLVVVSVTRL